jgi:hypothetical protein
LIDPIPFLKACFDRYGRDGVNLASERLQALDRGMKLSRKQPGMTRDIADRGIRRAYGADNATGAKIQSIRVVGKDFDVTIPRSQ